MTASPGEMGSLLLETHRHAWRQEPEPLDLALDEVIELLPNLIRSGSVGLVWPRLRHRATEYGAAGAALEAAYQSQAEHSSAAEQEIARLVSRLCDAGIRPVLIKGFAVSRLYRAPAIRPAGDIDLVVPDREYAAAKKILAGIVTGLSLHGERTPLATGSGGGIGVDLHRESTWQEWPGPDFRDRARPVTIGGVEVLVPCAEDHLRALCLHFLRHAAVRPMRLCDIALLAELDADRLEWERVLRGSRRPSEQVEITLRLAQELLGARLDDAPAAVRRRRIPSWLVPAVIRQWELAPTVRGPVLNEILANPRGIVGTFTRRWPDPITATLRTGAPFNEIPRRPVKFAAYVKQVGDYSVKRLPGQALAHLRDRP